MKYGIVPLSATSGYPDTFLVSELHATVTPDFITCQPLDILFTTELIPMFQDDIYTGAHCYCSAPQSDFQLFKSNQVKLNWISIVPNNSQSKLSHNTKHAE